MWRAEDSPRNVEPTITKKCRRTCWTKKWQNGLAEIGGWQPISTYINRPHLGSNGLHYVECPGRKGSMFSIWILVSCVLCWRSYIAWSWNNITNCLLVGLNMLHQSVVSGFDEALCRHQCRWRNNIFFLFDNLIFLDRRCWLCSGCRDIICILLIYGEMDKFCSMIYYLAILFLLSSSRNYLCIR